MLNPAQITLLYRYPYMCHTRQEIEEVFSRYRDGDLSYGGLCDFFGDALFTFILVELSSDGGCDSFWEASRRIISVMTDLSALATTLNKLDESPEKLSELIPELSGLEQAKITEAALKFTHAEAESLGRSKLQASAVENVRFTLDSS